MMRSNGFSLAISIASLPSRDRHALVSLDAQMQTHQVADVLFVLDDEHFTSFHLIAGAPARSTPLRFGAQSPTRSRLHLSSSLQILRRFFACHRLFTIPPQPRHERLV